MTATINRDDALEALSNQLRAVQDEIAILAEAEGKLKARIRDLITAGEVGEISAHGKPVVKVSYVRRFDPDTARSLLPAAMFEQICELVPTSAKAKLILAPAVYEACQKASATPSIAPVRAKS